MISWARLHGIWVIIIIGILATNNLVEFIINVTHMEEDPVIFWSMAFVGFVSALNIKWVRNLAQGE